MSVAPALAIPVAVAPHASPMCGKFTALASWREVVEFSQALTASSGGGDDGPSGGGDDDSDVVTYRVAGMLPVINWDAEAGKRRTVPMRWGFPSAKEWRTLHRMHVRAETIDSTISFRTPFLTGQRGIVLFRTFNEGEAVPTATGKTKTRQWTIDPMDGRPRGFAFPLAALRASRPAGARFGVRHGNGAREPAHPQQDHGERAGSAHAGDPRGGRLVNVAGRDRCEPRSGQGHLEDHGRGDVDRGARAIEAAHAVIHRRVQRHQRIRRCSGQPPTARPRLSIWTLPTCSSVQRAWKPSAWTEVHIDYDTRGPRR